MVMILSKSSRRARVLRRAGNKGGAVVTGQSIRLCTLVEIIPRLAFDEEAWFAFVGVLFLKDQSC